MTPDTTHSPQPAVLLRSVAEAVVATDARGLVTWLNPAAERLFGLTSAQALGQTLGALHPALAAWLERGALPPNGSEAPHPDQPRVLTFEAGTERYFSAALSPLRAGSDALEGWVLVAQEITHLKKVEQWKAEAIQAATHDLRNPLNLTNGALNLLRDSLTEPTSEQQECLAMIRSGLDRMSELVDQLLNLDQLDAKGEMGAVGISLKDVVRAVAEESRLVAEVKGLRFQYQETASGHPVVGDETWLHRAVANLVGNALKYTPPGGRVTISYREVDGQGICEVADTGPGISASDQARLFERFYRVRNETTRRVPGTGLGLAIVKAIVERHSGRVWVSSREGQGSTFGFSIPLKEHPA
jgi:two-component system phosphate regulon sensor histidine kinase PhoR